ncbi:MAG: AraC family transcriptional regulator [Clostridia bacterium]|nr:AraC family transcriptional regulator [Clostridia bacterium]
MMQSFFYKKVKSTEAVSNKYISVNNYGYYENITSMKVCRDQGRVDYQLIYVKRGELILENEGQEIVLTKGSVCLFRPKEAQIYRSSGIPVTYFWIHFSGYEVKEMLGFFKKKYYYVGDFTEFEYYCRDCIRVGKKNQEFEELYNVGQLIALFAKIGEKISSNGANDDDALRIRPALGAMNSDVLTRYTNDELAQLCALSKDYFLKVFKRVMDITPHQYYLSLVVDKGCYLLTNTSYNISEISRLCGIDDSLYFSRLFKKHTGLSPREYRK